MRCQPCLLEVKGEGRTQGQLLGRVTKPSLLSLTGTGDVGEPGVPQRKELHAPPGATLPSRTQESPGPGQGGRAEQSIPFLSSGPQPVATFVHRAPGLVEAHSLAVQGQPQLQKPLHPLGGEPSARLHVPPRPGRTERVVTLPLIQR